MAKSNNISSLVGEEIKDEIYRIVEIAVNEKLEELEKRIRDLEIAKAEIVEVENEIKQEIVELQRELKVEKKSVSKQLAKLSRELEKVNAALEVIIERL